MHRQIQIISRWAEVGVAAVLCLVGTSTLRAGDITSSVQATQGVDWSITGNVISATMSTVAPFDLPAGIYIDSNYTGTAAYNMVGTVSGSHALTSADTFDVFSFNNAYGTLSVNSTADIAFYNATGAPASSISNGALVVTAGSFGSSTANGPGGNVSVQQSGSIVVEGNGSVFDDGDGLVPEGFRMASLSGISAASFGYQYGGSSDTQSGGAVSVTTATNSSISISNTGSAIAAGISAASASGPGSTNGNYFNGGAFSGSAVNVTAAGTIQNTADAGIGIAATITGAQFLQSGATVASNEGVAVNLLASSTITMTGTAGIGVFAVNEVYTTSDPRKNTSVQAGAVNFNSAAGSSIVTGGTGSIFSVGVLAISAGTDFLIDPFSAHTANGSGSGAGGIVTGTNAGLIRTQGTMSIGLAALSLGGAGISTTNTGTTGDSAYLGNANGTSDANGSGGADVNVTNTGTISTVGTSAYGIVALSSGGGGLINNELDVTGSTGLVVGNNTNGGSASNGGTIFVEHAGLITTGDGLGGGDTSIGLIAQSIGGAGGNAGGKHPALFVGDKGGSGGAGGTVTVQLAAGGSIITHDKNSIGVLAQSIGGGGGNGANAAGIFVAVGGKGGSGGSGGQVTVNTSGSIRTEGDHSTGILAESIGGGGGSGGGADSVGLGVDLGIGGKGGGGGTGGAVNLNTTSASSITTLGNNSAGAHLQSVGGGGGNGGASIAKSGAVGTGEGVTFDINLSLGGSAGSGGTGGAVSGTNAGTITTGVANSGSNGLPNLIGADSSGLIAQSIGGGGGHGGSAIGKSLAFNAAEASSTTIKFDLALGGAGGSGGDGSETSLTNLGTVTTWGDGSHGMLAQSIGGGGGDGGDSTANSTLSAKSGVAATMTVAFGGTAGGGGAGGDVIVANSSLTALIATHGQSAAGIVAQSIGGGGGNGSTGNAGLHTPVTGTASAFNFNLTLGSSGASSSGGHAGYTEVGNLGTITTAGSGAQGILAQAIAGGGGNAGGGSAAGSNNNIQVNLALGSSGGAGGSATGTNSAGYSVQVTNSGTISTQGGGGSGIVAQSIGGGGGMGGTADTDASTGVVGDITTLIFSSTGYSSHLEIGGAIAGDGGGGGAGGNVLVAQDGTILTQGNRAYAVLAQSISGGGGNGGSATAASNPALFDGYDGNLEFSAEVAVGGKGGDGKNAQAVTVNNAGSLTTTGYGSHGILAQSIANGGGVGADGTVDVNTILGLGLGVNGGAAGTQGSGGAVNVTQLAAVTTLGGDASGIVAQSIGGGGGVGSTGSDRTLVSPSITAGLLPVHLDFSLGINLDTTSQGNGGAAIVQLGEGVVPSSVQTAGDWSHGVVAQSLGAGGGKASSIVGTNSNAYADLALVLGARGGEGAGGTTVVTLNDSLIATGATGTAGYGAHGIVAQSIGGGGGLATVDSAAATGSIQLGATGTYHTGGNGGTVTVSANSNISTQGAAAYGAILQSIGGGGGVAGVGSSRSFSGSAPSGPDITLGTVNSSGAGETVSGTFTSAVQTAGQGSIGLLAQSIGGGGGLVTTESSGTVRLGMQDSIASDSEYAGGAVNLTVQSVLTQGDNAHGIVAQSIGGGGGLVNGALAGGLSTATVASSNKSLGYGGTVDVTINGTVQTTGAGAYGLIAQSVSGGGGLSDGFAGATGGAGSTGTTNTSTLSGAVTVNQGASSHIITSGQNATAIFAQNTTAGQYGRGAVSVTLNGLTSGGSGPNGYGVWVDGGNSSNQLTVNNGAKLTALSGTAVNYTGGSHLDVLNSGTTIGAVSLSSGANPPTGSFSNQNTWVTEGLNNANVTDNGVLVIGLDSHTAATATFTGAYSQDNVNIFQNTTIVMDVFSASSYDQMLFAGSGHGTFDWNLTVNFSNSYQAQVGDLFTFIGGAAGNTYDNIFLDGVFTTGLGDGVTYDTFINPNGSFNLEITGVPEPGVVGLLAVSGMLAVATALRRRFARRAMI